jgi:hypothetical protein
MGGWGSGRRSNSKKITSDYQQFDIREWQRRGLLVPFSQAFTAGDWKVDVLIVRYLDPIHEWVIFSRLDGGGCVTAKFEWTRCNYGGRRAWLRCPTKECGRRVAILYAGDTVACRRCHDLAQAKTDFRSHSSAY